MGKSTMKKRLVKKTYLAVIIISAITALMTFSAVAVMTVKAEEPEKVFFTLHLRAPLGYKVREQVGVLLSEELPKIGIGVELEYHDFATLLDYSDYGAETGKTAAEGGFDMYLMGQGMDSSDPVGLTSWFHSLYLRPEGNNGWRFQNPEVDRLLEEGEVLLDKEERQELYWRVLEIVKEQAGSIELFYPTSWGARLNILENSDKFFRPYGTWTARDWTIAGKTEADETTVVTAIPTDVRNLIETLAEITYDRNAHNIMFDALIGHEYSVVDPDVGEPEPNLAESWEISDDGLTYTFHLRDDVKWHDGVTFTSKDVKFTYDAIMDIETAAADSIYWRENVESVETPDDYTVVIKFKKIFHAVWELILRRCIMPEHVLGDIPHEDWLTCPYNNGGEILTGTGPYKMIDWKRDEVIEFEAYDDYHMGRPFIDNFFIRIIPDSSVGLAALEAGEVTILGDQYSINTEFDRLDSDPDIDVLYYLPMWAQQLHLNMDHPILNNVWVRRAISYAIPREHICDDLALGFAEPATQWMAPARSWAYNPDLEMTPYDLGKARECMEKAGYDYDWLEPSVVPMSAYMLPALAGLIVGAVVGAGATYFLRR